MTISSVIEELRTIIHAAVKQALVEYENGRSQLERDRIYTEEEAAKLLRLNKRQLAAERKDGRIKASRIVGRQIRYLRQDIQEYMYRNRINDPDHPPRPEAGKARRKRKMTEKQRSLLPIASEAAISNAAPIAEQPELSGRLSPTLS